MIPSAATHDFMESVVLHLRQDGGIECSFNHPGYISIPCPPYVLNFGAVNNTWEGDVILEFVPGYVLETLDTGIPATCTDPTEVGLAILKAAHVFDRTSWGSRKAQNLYNAMIDLVTSIDHRTWREKEVLYTHYPFREPLVPMLLRIERWLTSIREMERKLRDTPEKLMSYPAKEE